MGLLINVKQILTFILIFTLVANAPVLAQKVTMELIKEGMDYIYNQEFQKSKVAIAEIERTQQKSAIPDLMKAVMAFWRYYPIYIKEDKLEIYQKYLLSSYDRAEEVLNNDSGNPEAIFLAIASQGLLAESYSESGHKFKAVVAAKRAYNYIKKGGLKLDQSMEFYLSTGLYNYYREFYPEAYPIYKPFMSFFKKGDRQLGIQQLEIAAQRASISHVIAQYYLSYIYMRYEYLPPKALSQGKKLHQSYPDNDLFLAIYLESLIINQRYREATPLAAKLQSNPSPYLKIFGDLFMGIIEERSHKNFPKAEELYRNALALNDEYEMERSHLVAFAYLGLGRIYEEKQDPKARKYFKEALNQAYTKAMKNEAKSHLN